MKNLIAILLFVCAAATCPAQYQPRPSTGTTLPSTTLPLKGNGLGGAVASVPGTDYALPAGTIQKLQPLSGNAINAANSLPAPTFPGTVFTAAATTGGSLAGNTTYFYRVTAYNGNGETLPSAEVSTTTAAGTNTNRVTINWNAVAGASAYNVYRATATGAELYLGYSNTTAYADTTSATPAGALPTLNTTAWGFGQRTLAIFHCDEGVGTSLADSSGNGLVGTYNGAWGAEAARVGYDASLTPGAGSSLALDGTSSYLTVPTLLDVAPATFTVSMQVRVPAGGLDTSPRWLFFKKWDSTHAVEALTFSGQLRAKTNNGNTQIISQALTWTPNATYGVTFVFSPSRMMIFRADPGTKQVVKVADSWSDAAYNSTASFGNPPSPGSSSYFSGTSPQPMCFGATTSSGAAANFSSLTLDEIVVEDHAWTPQEIETRTVKFQTYGSPTTERAQWKRSNRPTLTATQTWESAGGPSGNGVGEPTLIWDATAKRTHVIYTAGYTTPSVGYAYSDDYGQTFVKPLSSPIVGNGQGGVAGGGVATHASAIYAPDGYVYVAFSQNTANTYLAKSNLTTAGGAYTLSQVMTGGFAGGTGTAIVTSSTYSNTGPRGAVTYIGNSSLAYANGSFYVASEVGYSGSYQTLFAKCATINGTYTAITPAFSPSLQPTGTIATQMSAPGLTYDPAQNLFHLYAQFQNAPCEVWHWVSADCSGWTQASAAENNPAFSFLITSTNTVSNSSYADQLGDPTVTEVTAPDGSKMCLATVTYVNNQNYPATARVYTYTYQGSLASLAATAPVSGVAPVPQTGSIALSALSTPPAPVITNFGTTGSSTWTYQVVARQNAGTTAASASASTTTGNGTLNSNQYNVVTWQPVSGATGYDIYRTAVGTSPATTGKIGSAATGATTLGDVGLVGDGTTAPTVNTTGTLNFTSGASINGLPLPTVLATSTGINALAAANTALYTVPPGKTCVVTGYNVRVTAASGVTAPASAGLGTTAGTSNISAAQTLTGTTTLNAGFLFPITGASIVTPSGGTVFFNLSTGATGTSETLSTDLVGYLF